MSHTITNFEKWRNYMDGFISPDNFINFGFYYMIAAALQRRVWVGPDHSRLFPNMFVIPVGEPGIGKGLVIKQVAEFLRYHKLPDPATNGKATEHAVTDADKIAITEITKKEYEQAEEATKSSNKADFEKPLLFPVASDATTYEALIRAMSRAIRRKSFKRYDAKQQKEVMDVYTHSSLCFALEEISSLFRKRTEDTVHFLIQAFDCGDYEYDTKTQGKDRVRKCCLNFFGGTTPGFLQQVFNDQLISEGFSSRTLFIFAPRNRKSAIFVPELNEEQLRFKQDILDHLLKLNSLYGRVHVAPDTMKWLEDWWAAAQESRPNSNYKLNPYYSRKNIHVLKMAMAIHFAESTKMEITKEELQQAINMLNDEERRMHYALGLDNSNPLSKLAKKITDYLNSAGKRTRQELLAEFWESLPNGKPTDIDDVIEHLMSTGKLTQIKEPHPTIKDEALVKYTVRKGELTLMEPS